MIQYSAMSTTGAIQSSALVGATAYLLYNDKSRYLDLGCASLFMNREAVFYFQITIVKGLHSRCMPSYSEQL